MSIGEVLVAVFFPPVSVLFRYGISGKFFLAIILTMLGWLPGVIYAFIVLSKEPYLRKH